MIKISIKNNSLVVYGIGSFNLQMGLDIKTILKDNVNDSTNKIIISFKEINYINSDGLRELLEISKKLKENKKVLMLAELNDNTKELFHFTCLYEVFEIIDKLNI
jgi:anti-anti-sigma factor